MKSWILALCAAAVVPFGTGCAEEEGDWREPAYPVGVSSVPPSPPPPATVAPAAPSAPTATAPQPSLSEPASEPDGVVVGDDADAEPPPAESSGDTGDTDPSALTDFHAALDPYGSWVEDPTYGTVWVPSENSVGADFVPYQTAGHWTYDDDYIWASDYEWGWAPFHYGRWVYAGIGWEWIPGRTYAGAWVSWRYGSDGWGYVGWAPLAPTWCWRHGVAVGIGFVPAAPYGFVATGDLFAPRLGGRFVAGERAGLIGAHTRPWVVGSAGGGLGGRVLAHPVVGGPPPSALHITQSAVVQTGTNRGVLQARAFAKPAAGGARTTFASAAGTQEGLRGGAPQGFSQRAVAPAYGPPAPSRYTTRFTGSAASRASTPYPGAAGYTGGTPRPYVSAAPAYHAATPAPTFRSAPSMPAGHAFTGGGSTGGFHGGGGYSGGFHAGGGGGFGGYHGGGGGGSRGGGGHGGGRR